MKSSFIYYLLQLVTFILLIVMSAGIMNLVAPDTLLERNNQIKIVLEALFVVVLSHFVIRLGYKKINLWLGQKKHALLTLLLLSFFAALLNFGGQRITSPLFPTSLSEESIKVELKSGQQRDFVAKKDQYLLAFASDWVVFIFWSIAYLALTNSRDKKLLGQQLQNQQLKSLMNQLNPHFLFNAMNTIRGMIYEDQDKAAELLTQLSELFRYNLSSGVKVAATLKDELEICQSYLDIEQLRLGERLQIKQEIATNTLDAQLPGMGLITLVENAVKHGIAPLPAGGVLAISASKEQEQVVLTITNPYQEDYQASGTGTGLLNLTQRLNLMFGRQAQLLKTTSENVFQVQLRFPV
ncbi:histidine kinase [Thalassomonas sp. RHCl1]|uniref:sensor histidine kinase n=1 Tax=Thalassomonas sp. RHCl1 TaxID=2995320 RepID=UPI00248CECDA|nr:histidine kinase [Thalassomonas sp. RHCl1]